MEAVAAETMALVVEGVSLAVERALQMVSSGAAAVHSALSMSNGSMRWRVPIVVLALFS